MSIPKGTAPLRCRLCICRVHEDIQVDDEWEPWEKLIYKGLRRKGIPARVSLTIFASAKHVIGQETESQATSEDTAMPSTRMAPVPELDEDPSLPESKRQRLQEPETSKDATETPMVDRTTIDLASLKHGPKFLALKPETQAWLIKVHRNLGHPGAQKLVEFCRQLGCPSEILNAIGDLKCSTCGTPSTQNHTTEFHP